MYSSTALNERFCKAPIVSFTGMPSCTRPTSVSSRLPRKMRSFILATVAIVVPSLNVLLMITELPTLIGTSRISPVMVERINVLLNEALFLVIPSFTISRLSLAVCNSSRACFTFTSPFSYSSLLMSLSLNNFSTRAKSVSACLALISARRTRLSAEFSVPSSGITFTLAITSPCLTLCPASLYTSEMIPDICGLISTSSLGSTFPVATVVFSKSAVSGTMVSYTFTVGWDFRYKNTNVQINMAATTASDAIFRYFFVFIFIVLFFYRFISLLPCRFLLIPYRFDRFDGHCAVSRCQSCQHP